MKLFSVLSSLDQPGCRLCSDSWFVDLGSGFGLPVFSALAASDVRCVTGVELMSSRLGISRVILADVKRLLPAGSNVQFIHGDITKPSDWATQRFTHVFSFDAAFTDATCTAIAQGLLALQSWTVFISSRRKDQWARWGLADLTILAKVAVSMRTSSEQRTLFVFKRLAPGETPAQPLDSVLERQSHGGQDRGGGGGKRGRPIEADTADTADTAARVKNLKQRRGRSQGRGCSGVWDHATA
jgi:hypothetical protein